MSEPLFVSFGYGTNSFALLCGLKERGIVPTAILAADTGAEMPHSYLALKQMQARVKEWWGLEIHIVKATRGGNEYTIEDHCHKTKKLPSLAYGLRSCSQKFKHEPMEKWIKNWARANGVNRIIKAIGYGADERQRAEGKPAEKKLLKNLTETYWYPLIEWGWRREECRDAICRHKLTQPGKSACFFCPASKPSEVFNLAKAHPDLMARALRIENDAQAHHRKNFGLGGSGNLWKNWAEADTRQLKLLDLEPQHRPCNCTDGDHHE